MQLVTSMKRQTRDTQRAVSTIRTGVAGRSRHRVTGGTTPAFTVFDNDGRLVGTIDAPSEHIVFRPNAATFYLRRGQP